MTNFQIKHRAAGFSLIEAMVVVVVVAVMALGVATLSQNISTTAATQKYLVNTNNFAEEIRALLSDPANCQQTFTSAPVNLAALPVGIANVQDSAGTIRYDTALGANAYADRAGTFTSMTLDQYNDGGAPLLYGTARLTLIFSATAQVPINGGQAIKKTILLQTHRTPGFIVDGCVALSHMQSRVFNAGARIDERVTGAAWQNIINTTDAFYNTGRVGINLGVDAFGVPLAPAYPLEVRRALAAASVASPVIAWGDPVGGQSLLTSVGGGTIELNGSLPAVAPAVPSTPYVDFHFGNGAPEQFNVRLRNTARGRLTMASATKASIAEFLTGTHPLAPNPNTGTLIINGTPLDISTYNPFYAMEVRGDLNVNGTLFVSNNPLASCTNAGCTGASDIRLKKNIKPLTNSLEQILQLRGVSYQWKDKERFGKGPQIGFIAQEVEKVYPLLVETDPRSGLKSVNYSHMIAPAVEAIKHLHTNLMRLESKSEQLSADDEQLALDNSELKKRILALEEKVRTRKAVARRKK